MKDSTDRLSFPKRVMMALPFFVINGFGYMYLNHTPPIPPTALPMTWVDHAVPFMAWTVWPYLFLLALDFILPFVIRSATLFFETIRAYVIAMTLNFSVWIMYPTTYPRPPLSSVESLSEKIYAAMITLDTPVNCFPSGHITIPTVLLWAVLREHPRHRFMVWTAFLIMSFSIVTTKQHYIIDYVGGLMTAGFGIGFSQWISYMQRQQRQNVLTNTQG